MAYALARWVVSPLPPQFCQMSDRARNVKTFAVREIADCTSVPQLKSNCYCTGAKAPLWWDCQSLTVSNFQLTTLQFKRTFESMTYAHTHTLLTYYLQSFSDNWCFQVSLYKCGWSTVRCIWNAGPARLRWVPVREVHSCSKCLQTTGTVQRYFISDMPWISV